MYKFLSSELINVTCIGSRIVLRFPTEIVKKTPYFTFPIRSHGVDESDFGGLTKSPSLPWRFCLKQRV